MQCKLKGADIQYLEIHLEPGEEFFAERGALIYADTGINMNSEMNGNGLLGALGASFSGESWLIIRYRNESRMMRRLVVGASLSLLHIRMQGESVICKKGGYVASTTKMNISSKLSIAGFLGGMGGHLQRISGQGTVFLESNGVPIPIDIPPGDSIVVDENHLVAMQGISENQLSAENFSLKNRIMGEGWSLMRIYGPGRVFMAPMPMIKST